MTKQKKSKQEKLVEPNRPPVEVTWVKLQRPKNWRPKVGAELVGYYLGQTYRNGKYGQYKVATISVPGEPSSQAFTVSGTTVIQALDTADVQQGQLVRVVFNGYKELKPRHDEDKVRKMKLFDVYAAAEQLTRDQVIALASSIKFD